LPDAKGQPRLPGDRAGCDAPRRRGAKRTSAELEAVVLSILRASPRPLGAYAIARKSRSLGVPLSPNQVYRILERLRGRVRRVETLNAYFEDRSDAAAVTLCRACGRAGSLRVDLGPEIMALARAKNFRAENVIIEVRGKCPDCAAVYG